MGESVDARLARVEEGMKHTQADLKEIKETVKLIPKFLANFEKMSTEHDTMKLDVASLKAFRVKIYAIFTGLSAVGTYFASKFSFLFTKG
jgi:predicted fused transcriptional regulator/phosphomethylpyrimidine kinase